MEPNRVLAEKIMAEIEAMEKEEQPRMDKRMDKLSLGYLHGILLAWAIENMLDAGMELPAGHMHIAHNVITSRQMALESGEMPIARTLSLPFTTTTAVPSDGWWQDTTGQWWPPNQKSNQELDNEPAK